MIEEEKKAVLFVGGFSVPADGTEGGQVFASRSLIASPLNDRAIWKLIDSTQRSEPPPGILVRALDAFMRILKLVWSLLTTRVDVVLIFSSSLPLSMLEKGLMCILARLAGKRVVLSLRFHPYVPSGMPRAYTAFVRFACRCCTTIMTQNQLAADDLSALFAVDPNKTKVVHNWVDTTVFRPSNRHVRPAESERVVQIIYVGWLHPHKGLEYLLRGVELLAKTRSNFHLSIVGDGVLADDLRQLSAELGIDDVVTFVGWVPNRDIPKLLNQSDVFAFATLHEGMPNALLQAMACGLPLVSTNVSGIPEIVDDGVNGFLVPPRSPDSLSVALGKLVDDPAVRRRMGEANVERIRANHDIASTWPRVGEILGLTD